MPNQDRRTILPRQHALCRCYRFRQRCRGFCTAVTLRPAACSRAITSDQDDPSANSPCTRTTLRAASAGGAAAGAPWKRVLAAPAAPMPTKEGAARQGRRGAGCGSAHACTETITLGDLRLSLQPRLWERGPT